MPKPRARLSAGITPSAPGAAATLQLSVGLKTTGHLASDDTTQGATNGQVAR